jgi:superfamily II DNA helicase RecQ
VIASSMRGHQRNEMRFAKFETSLALGIRPLVSGWRQRAPVRHRAVSAPVDMVTEELKALKKYWGHDSFRACQEEVIANVRSGRDSLVVMATGAGKSICYQIPPFVTQQPCVVISPLISLMEDQVSALQAHAQQNEKIACYLGSAQNRTAGTSTPQLLLSFAFLFPAHKHLRCTSFLLSIY